MKRILRTSIIYISLICLGLNSFAQTFDPLSLHFKKDYQIRNFYNSSVLLSKLDLSQDVLNESIYPKVDLHLPGAILNRTERFFRFLTTQRQSNKVSLTWENSITTRLSIWIFGARPTAPPLQKPNCLYIRIRTTGLLLLKMMWILKIERSHWRYLKMGPVY